MRTENVILDHQVRLKTRRHFGAADFAVLPAFAIAFLPKCPLCLMGVLSVVGFVSSVNTSWLFPLSLVLFCGAVLPLLIRARCGVKPFITGLCAAILILFGKFYLALDWLAYAGLIALFVATVWSIWQNRKPEAACQDECVLRLSPRI